MVYNDRDEATHLHLASDMLFTLAVAPTTPAHPDLQSFCEGFNLPCPGFSFIEVGADSAARILLISS